MNHLITMNVTDLRQKLRRSPLSQLASEVHADRRKTSDRRRQQVSVSELGVVSGSRNRVWLTPGERNLIEDLYLLD
jgi:hypothetical protein